MVNLALGQERGYIGEDFQNGKPEQNLEIHKILSDSGGLAAAGNCGSTTPPKKVKNLR